MKKLLILLLVIAMSFSTFALVACNPEKPEEPKPPITDPDDDKDDDDDDKKPVVAEFEGVYTNAASAKDMDTFIFKGETTDDIITKLSFDIFRNMGTDKEYDKTELAGYSMNVSDVVISESEGVYKLDKFTCYGYHAEAGEFMYTAKIDVLTDTTTFGDLSIGVWGKPVEMEKAIKCYSSLAKEVGIETLTEETLVKDMFVGFDRYADGQFVVGSKRLSFDGPAGGRSYGEQIDAIVAYILKEKMTLEEVYTMFQTVNQGDTEIMDRTEITGATIAFVGDFQRVVYVAIHGELFEGVTDHTVADDGSTKVNVVTQGYGGELESTFTFDTEGKLIAVKFGNHRETAGIGGVHLEADSDFVNGLLTDGVEADTVAGATVTTSAVLKALGFAIEYFKAL